MANPFDTPYLRRGLSPALELDELSEEFRDLVSEAVGDEKRTLQQDWQEVSNPQTRKRALLLTPPVIEPFRPGHLLRLAKKWRGKSEVAVMQVSEVDWEGDLGSGSAQSLPDVAPDDDPLLRL